VVAYAAAGVFTGIRAATLRRVSAQQFVLELGRAMHMLGSPAYRVEDTMDACSRALGLEGVFFATPTAIFVAIGSRGAEVHTSLLRVVPGTHDLGRLAELYALRDAVMRREIDTAEGIARLRGIREAPPPYGRGAAIAAMALASAGAGPLFGGGPAEMAVAGAAGLLVGALDSLSGRDRRIADVVPGLACALVAFLVHATSVLVTPLQVREATLAAIVVLLPGLSFTTALAELAIRHLSAGSARLMGSLAVLLTMAIGVGIGDRCGELAFGPARRAEAGELAWPWLAATMFAIAVAFTVLLRASRRQVLWVLIAVVLGFCGARLGHAVFGPGLGAFLGAMIVGLGANLFARVRRLPAAIVRTPGLLLLVPGSLGFRGVSIALQQDFAASAQFAMQMLIVGGAIVAGMLLAGVILPPPLDVEVDSRGRPDVP
jgi:uncharacterized membrane protein YjjP (DUF1212 family)